MGRAGSFLRHGPLLLALLVPGMARGFDVEQYGELLQRHTRVVDDAAGVRVDYAALATSPEWRRVVDSLGGVDAGALSRDEGLAFWINAYNIAAMDLVARGEPADSIRDLGSLFRPVWKRPAGVIAGRERTLHEIEHEILRPMGEPRIHAAIVCASVSCPALRREPWRAERLDAQLDDAMRRFLASPEKGLRLEAVRRTVRLSKIFDWFAGDFERAGGVLPFAARFAPQPARAWLRQNADVARVAWLPYDWSLNALRGR